jgi:peptidoglycan hydrolase-like protein with peptidoglycan-binding domain
MSQSIAHATTKRPDELTKTEVAKILALIRSARGDDAEVRRLERLLLVEPDTSPREGDPPPVPSIKGDAGLANKLARATPDRVLAVAEHEIGYVERAQRNTKYGEWYGDNHQWWCAMFVSWVFYNAGLPLPATQERGFESCSAGRAWFVRRRRFTTTPARGLVVFYDWDGRAPLDHVGIVRSVNTDGSIVAIEGNTSNPNGGAHGVFPKPRRFGIVGYGIPDYGYGGGTGNLPRELPLLQRGNSGTHVRRLQGLLRAAYPALDDAHLSLGGDFGPVTEELVRQFQTENSLEIDGQVGDKTWRALLGLSG